MDSPRSAIMMKAYLYVMVVSTVILGMVLPALGNSPEDTVTQYMEAIKKGDVVAIKSHIGGKLLKRRQVLLEQNRKYPEFLRTQYDGVDYQILGTEAGPDSNQRTVKIELQFPDGRQSLSLLILEQTPQGTWHVIDQNRDQ